MKNRILEASHHHLKTLFWRRLIFTGSCGFLLVLASAAVANAAFLPPALKPILTALWCAGMASLVWLGVLVGTAESRLRSQVRQGRAGRFEVELSTYFGIRPGSLLSLPQTYVLELDGFSEADGYCARWEDDGEEELESFGS